MTEQIDAFVDVFVLLSCMPFLGWLNGDGSIGQPPVLTLIPLFWDKPQKGSDDYGQK